jgi:glycosyltransferase involved in cell wall biosynthesis
VSNFPEVSFIVCTRNRAKYVEKCVKNLLSAESFKDFEVIVRDNCSNDNTEDVLRKIKDPKLKYFRASKNEGWATFLEAGKLASGNLITWLSDEDDFLFENLNHIIETFKIQTSCNVLIGGVLVGPNRTPIVYSESISGIQNSIKSYFISQQFSGCGGVFIRKAAFVEGCAIRFEDQFDAYVQQNFYQISYIASRSLQGKKLYISPRILISENRHAPTTDNWSEPLSLNPSVKPLQPHYYPLCLRDRLVSQVFFVLKTKHLKFLEKIILIFLHVSKFISNISAHGNFKLLELLKNNYPEESVRKYISEILRLRLNAPLRRVIWICITLFRVPIRLIYFNKSVKNMNKEKSH